MRPRFDPDARPDDEPDTGYLSEPVGDDHPDAAQFIADALGIELTDTQRLILTDGSGDRYTLGKPIPRRPDAGLTLTQRIRGTEAHTVVLDECITDGDGNPLSRGFRDELDAQRAAGT